jgi:hypothetical protein
MMPTAEQMIVAAQQALKDFVVPVVEDQWAASALRSVDVILSHLAVRTSIEGPMLHEDNLELVALLGKAEDLGLGNQETAAFRAEAAELLQNYASVFDLFALNHRGREAVDALLLVCRERRGEAAVDVYHDDLRAYLLRHADRESPLFFPVYVGRPV